MILKKCTKNDPVIILYLKKFEYFFLMQIKES